MNPKRVLKFWGTIAEYRPAHNLRTRKEKLELICPLKQNKTKQQIIHVHVCTWNMSVIIDV